MDNNLLTPPESSTAKTRSAFQLAYEGPAVADGSMDVRNLAPALGALDDFVQRSNELLNGDCSKVTLRVVAGFDKGSFDINLLLDQGLRDPMAAMLPAVGALSASQILDLALGTYEKAEGIISGVARIYKAVRGARPVETKPGRQSNTTILVFGNNNTVVTDSSTARLYNDDRLREALTKAAEPLLRDGMEKLDFKRDNHCVERLERPDVGELPAYDLTANALEAPEGLPRDIWVRVVKPNFDGGRWTFHDGSAKFGAEVEDRGFQSRVDSREQGFCAGDTFLIRLRSTQHIDKNGGITTRNVVEKVLDQRSSPKQRPLLDSESNGTTRDSES